MAKNGQKVKKDVVIHGQKVRKIEISNLKGIKNMELFFDKPLTALVGPNCIGKTTILDALASVYKDTQQFSDFFIPNKYNDWSESEFKVHFEFLQNGVKKIRNTTYKKAEDRWTPVNSRRPIRNVLYLRISDELPEYEKKWDKEARFHEAEENPIPKENTIITKSKAILSQDYSRINEVHVHEETSLLSVKNNDIEYLSLDMGAGEQKIIKYMMMLEGIEKYSLVLIDELDVFIHSRSFKEFIIELSKVAAKKELQIIFTTLNDIITKCENFVDVKYLMKTDDRTLVLEEPTPDVLYYLNGERKRDYEIFVEDALSECIVQDIVAELGERKNTEILCFGAAINAFTISAGLRLSNYKNFNRVRFVLDGDVHSSDDEKKNRINAILTGNTGIADGQRSDVMSSIIQYNLPKGKKPEEFIADILLGVGECDKDILEMKQVIRDNYSAVNKHSILEQSLEELNYGKKIGYNKIITLIKNEEAYREFVSHVRNSLEALFL